MKTIACTDVTVYSQRWWEAQMRIEVAWQVRKSPHDEFGMHSWLLQVTLEIIHSRYITCVLLLHKYRL